MTSAQKQSINKLLLAKLRNKNAIVSDWGKKNEYTPIKKIKRLPLGLKILV